MRLSNRTIRLAGLAASSRSRGGNGVTSVTRVAADRQVYSTLSVGAIGSSKRTLAWSATRMKGLAPIHLLTDTAPGGSSSTQRSLHTSTSRSESFSPPPSTPPNPSTSSAYPSYYPSTTTTHLSPDILLRCTIFDSSGSATSTSGVFKKSRLCSDHGLEPRDLRKIDSRVPNLVPTILARRGGILVNILHIRAMIKKDKVLLFDSYGSTNSSLVGGFVYNLQHNLRPVSSAGSGGGSANSGGGLAYEFRALESILVSVLDALRIELGVVRGWTSNVLQELDDDVDREKLRTLLQVSRKLNAFLSRAKAVKGAVVEVLENEEDMELMYLSRPPPSSSHAAASSTCRSDSTSSGPAVDKSTESGPEMDELELLLESFDKQVEEVVSETTQLSSDISNTQEVVELILDNNRNKLLALDLKTSIATMGISAGTLWAGLFGMNLKSHMEEMDYAFATVSGLAVVAVGITMGVGLRRLERLRRVGLGSGAGREGKRGRVGDGEKKRGWFARLRSPKDAGVKKVEVGAGMGGSYYPVPPGMVGGGYYQPQQQYGQQGWPSAPLYSSNGYTHSYPHSPHAASSDQSPASPHSQPYPAPTATATATVETDTSDIGGAESSVGLGLGLGSKWNSSGTKKKQRDNSTS